MGTAEAELRKEDWEMRKQAVLVTNIDPRLRYERVTFGAEGPGPTESALLEKVARSAGQLIMLHDKDCSDGYIGRAKEVEYKVDYEVYQYDQLEALGYHGEATAFQTTVSLVVPNLKRFWNVGGAHYVEGDKPWYFYASKELHEVSYPNYIGFINVLRHDSIIPCIVGYNRNDTPIYDFNQDFETTTRHGLGNNITNGMSKPVLHVGDKVYDWFEYHAVDGKEVLQRYIACIDKTSEHI